MELMPIIVLMFVPYFRTNIDLFHDLKEERRRPL